MKTYKYKGKIRTAAAGKLVFPGGTYELPEDDNHVKALVAQSLLEEIKIQEPIKNKK